MSLLSPRLSARPLFCAVGRRLAIALMGLVLLAAASGVLLVLAPPVVAQPVPATLGEEAFERGPSPQITVNVTYLVGSRHEGYGETGMAHLLEHMLFKATRKFPNLWQDMQARGFINNGTTWLDRTNYFERFAANEENLRWALEMEADRMVNAKLLPEEFAAEMTVVRNEFE
ncbi:MAG: M16 family metallopeptidase, partial [Casimicrobiaceae bacterium]